MRACSWRKLRPLTCLRNGTNGRRKSGRSRKGNPTQMTKPLASLSLDLDNEWSYLKTHGDAEWRRLPSYLDTVVPRVMKFLAARENQRITFFVVGQDAALKKNEEAIASIAHAGHEIGNHS